MIEEKTVTCTMCDQGCMVMGEVEDGKILRLKGMSGFCIKAAHALEYYDHPDRLLRPLKRNEQ